MYMVGQLHPHRCKSNLLINLLHHHVLIFGNYRLFSKVRRYLHQAKLIDSLRLHLRSGDLSSIPRIIRDPFLNPFVVANALRSAPSVDSALFLLYSLESLPISRFRHDQASIFTFAKILAKSKRTKQLNVLIDSINSGRFVKIPCVSFMNRMQWAAWSNDLDSALRVWDELRVHKRRPSTEFYNILIGIHAQNGNNSEAVDLFHKMVEEGAIPNSRTYTVMIKHIADSGNLDSAFEVFKILPFMRIKRTSKQYSVLIERFVRAERFTEVKSMLDEMVMDGILPCRVLWWSLQCMRDAGFVEETDPYLKGMVPDPRVNNVQLSVDDEDEDVDHGDDDGDDEDEDVDHGDDEDEDVDHGDDVLLKPWFDPRALALALEKWSHDDVEALEGARFVWTTRVVCKVLRSFKSPLPAWGFFCWVACQPGFTHDTYTVQRMMTISARHGDFDLVSKLASKMKSEGILLPFSTIRLIIDFFGCSKQHEAALSIFSDRKQLCGPISDSNLVVLYGCLLRTLAKCDRIDDIFTVLDEMFVCETYPDVQIFSGLMHYFALKGDMRIVHRLLMMVRQSGVEPDAYMFKVLIQAYCKCRRPSLALRVFNDMMNFKLMVDTRTKNFLVMSLWKEGKRREVAILEEKCEEMNTVIPLALCGHEWTVSSRDIIRVSDIYSNCFKTNIIT